MHHGFEATPEELAIWRGGESGMMTKAEHVSLLGSKKFQPAKPAKYLCSHYLRRMATGPVEYVCDDCGAAHCLSQFFS